MKPLLVTSLGKINISRFQIPRETEAAEERLLSLIVKYSTFIFKDRLLAAWAEFHIFDLLYDDKGLLALWALVNPPDFARLRIPELCERNRGPLSSFPSHRNPFLARRAETGSLLKNRSTPNSHLGLESAFLILALHPVSGTGLQNADASTKRAHKKNDPKYLS